MIGVGTIRSLMDGHCVELVSPDHHAGKDGVAPPEAEGWQHVPQQSAAIATTPCNGNANQQFTATALPAPADAAFTISQHDGSGRNVCIQSSPSPPGPGPPPPPCAALKNQSACVGAKNEHCIWAGGSCENLPKPPPPPPAPMQPAVPEADWDQFFTIEDNVSRTAIPI